MAAQQRKAQYTVTTAEVNNEPRSTASSEEMTDRSSAARAVSSSTTRLMTQSVLGTNQCTMRANSPALRMYSTAVMTRMLICLSNVSRVRLVASGTRVTYQPRVRRADQFSFQK